MGIIVQFRVPAVPVAQPRQRHRIIQGKDGKAFAQNYTPERAPVQTFKATVRMAAAESYSGPPLKGPCRVDVLFVFPRHRNKCWKKRPMPRYPHTTRPDRDNLDKAVLDAMKGTIFADDCQAFSGLIEKWHAAGDEQPHCRITVTEWGNNNDE